MRERFDDRDIVSGPIRDENPMSGISRWVWAPPETASPITPPFAGAIEGDTTTSSGESLGAIREATSDLLASIIGDGAGQPLRRNPAGTPGSGEPMEQNSLGDSWLNHALDNDVPAVDDDLVSYLEKLFSNLPTSPIPLAQPVSGSSRPLAPGEP